MSRGCLLLRQPVRLTIRALGVDVDKPHLHGSERVFELPIAGVAFVTKPRVLGTPVHVFVRSPGIHATTGETNVLNPIDSRATLPASIMRSAQEIFLPYFCLIGQSSLWGLIEVHVVRPNRRT